VLNVALIALTAAAVVSVVLVVRWFTAAPATVWWPLLAAPLAVVSVVVCAEAAGWHSRRCRLAARS
jgi:hypothetical protein